MRIVTLAAVFVTALLASGANAAIEPGKDQANCTQRKGEFFDHLRALKRQKVALNRAYRQRNELQQEVTLRMIRAHTVAALDIANECSLDNVLNSEPLT